MAVYSLREYPHVAQLRDGLKVTLRPMAPYDGERLLEFFLRVPEEDRFFLKDDVMSPQVIDGWTSHLDYDRALPLLAVLEEGRILGDAVLIRQRGGSRGHIGEIRAVIDPEHRGKGLGVLMMRELIQIAYDADLEMVIFEFVKDAQGEAIKAAEFLGAFSAGMVSDLAKDLHGRLHDVVFLKLPLGKWWEWSQF